jgi:hypothetical protein
MNNRVITKKDISRVIKKIIKENQDRTSKIESIQNYLVLDLGKNLGDAGGKGGVTGTLDKKTIDAIYDVLVNKFKLNPYEEGTRFTTDGESHT